MDEKEDPHNVGHGGRNDFLRVTFEIGLRGSPPLDTFQCICVVSRKKYFVESQCNQSRFYNSRRL